MFYSHVNYSVTKIAFMVYDEKKRFYSHVNYSVTKICHIICILRIRFYSHVNYSVTKIVARIWIVCKLVLQSRKLFSY